ncbi:hypothetical protein AHMF7605_01230 [Adhaeribacter arboris]|uniref:Uncharacterized protein n=2 Tax=Adhaeribacter arboris TaxID=2072846 RepID=A0A2T2Y9N9_9BACT|nr:hypothetical protein AHMF7605_01230 [Adhaeribacter arboris]
MKRTILLVTGIKQNEVITIKYLIKRKTMSIDALRLIPQEDSFNETSFEQEITSRHQLQDHPAMLETIKTILKLLNPVRVNGVGDHEVTTLFRDTVFKNRNSIGTTGLNQLAEANLSDENGTLTAKGVELVKAIAASYKGVEGELVY